MLSSLRKRVLNLERQSSAGNATLRFADGTTRAIVIRDPLGLVLARFRRIHARDEGLSCPESPFDAQIELLDRAESIESVEPLLTLKIGE